MSNPRLLKQSASPLPADELERSVVVWRNRPITIAFTRDSTGTHGKTIRVRDFFSEEILAENPWTGGLGCATVIEGVITIFGSTNWAAHGNAIVRSTLDANYVPSAAQTVIQCEAGDTFYNCEIARRPDGWMLVAEKQQGGIRFYYSTNSFNFGAYGGCMNSPPFFYCACPTIDFNYADGYTYLTALRLDNGIYSTKVCRSVDLNTFVWSPTPLLTPNLGDEGTDASDVSYCEYRDQVLLTYLVGTQGGVLAPRKAIYTGRLDQMLGEGF